MLEATHHFGRTYDEAMTLLIQARDYNAGYDAADRWHMPAHVRLKASFESLRVTSRLTQVMAWLLAQKAVHAGELTNDDLAGETFRLDGGELCRDPSGADDCDLPAGLRRLLERSHHLYIRVSRLDEQVRRHCGRFDG